MAWDLAISSVSDLVLNHSNDLAGKSGTDLIEQRMKIRIKLHRGAWGYDEDDTLGSQVYLLLGMPLDRAASLAPAYVREALRDMEEIQVDNVHVFPDPDMTSSLVLVIDYHVLDDLGAASDEAAYQLDLTISAGGSV